MNTSQFMDKQIMDLSSSSLSPPHDKNDKDFIDLMNNPQDDDHQKQHSDGNNRFESKKEEIVPSYDFQPILPPAGLSQSASNLAGSANNTARLWSPSDSKPDSSSSIRNYGSLDSHEPAKFILEKDRNVPVTSILFEIDQTMKKHSDNLLHVLEGVSARLTQLETRSRNLEKSVDDLKDSVGSSHGSTDGKMRQLENILREVQSGVEVLKDKQEIVEAQLQLQLSKLQVSKVDPQPEPQNPTLRDSTTQPPHASPPQPHPHQLPPPISFPQPLPASAAPPPIVPQQNLTPTPPQPPAQRPLTQFPPSQPEPYFPPPGQIQNQPPSSQPPYQAPPPPIQLPHQPQYQTPPPQPPQYPQPQQPSQPSPGYHQEEPSYATQSFPQNPSRQPPSQPPPASPAASQQYYGAPPSMYEPSSGRPGSMFTSGYAPQSGSSEPYPYGGPAASQFGSTPGMKPHSVGGGTGYPQLPTARPLPHALPMASGVGSGGSPRSGDRVPMDIDGVVDKVTSMGFSREQVRATVRKLTESGQAVDLNIVLDKLMNEGGMQQPPQRGWFGGR